MDPLVVVTHPQPIALEARPLGHDGVPDGVVALGYYYDGHLIARGVVGPDALQAIHDLLARPVSLALAAVEDDAGNIDARICLILPIDLLAEEHDGEGADEPWKASLPSVPAGIESAPTTDDGDMPRLALLPIGNVIRGHDDRRHPDNVAADVREMLDNLMGGHARDSVQKAIDDLLDSL